MLLLTAAPTDDLERTLDPAVRLLRAGGIVAYPTDTLYGLAVDPRQHDAVERLLRTKRRQPGNAIPLIAADMAQVEQVGAMSELGRRLAARFWPGPLTMVIHVTGPIDPEVHQHKGTIAIRVPAHPVACALARGLGWPITSTSANLGGQAEAGNAAEVRATLGDTLDAIIDGGPVHGGAASTIVDVTAEQPRLVRDGAVRWERVLEFIESARDI